MTEAGKILLIDENREITSLLSDVLKLEGYSVIVAHTGEEGLNAAQWNPVSLVLLELRLPDTAGMELVTRFQRLHPPPKIVIMTEQAALGSTSATVEVAAGYIQKPIDLIRLRALVGRLFNGRSPNLQADLERRARRLTALVAAATASGALSLDEVLVKSLDSTMQAVGMDGGVIRLLDEASGELVVATVRGSSKEIPNHVRNVKLGEGFSGSVALTKRPLFVPDTSREPRTARFAEVFGPGSAASLPLMVQDRVLGTMSLMSRQFIDFAGEDMETLVAISRQVGLAVENARLYEAAQRQARELATLHEVGTALASTLDMAQVLETIADSAVGLIGAKLCTVFELDSQDQRLHPRTTRALPLELMPVLKLGQGVVGSAALLRRPVFISDCSAEPLPMADEPVEGTEMPLGEVARRMGFRAILAVPLVSKDVVLGAIGIYWDKVPASMEREVQLLTALAQQAALAVENARLYQEAAAQRTRLTQIFDSTSDGIMLVNRAGQIATANRRAGELLELDPSKVIGAGLVGVLAGLHDAPDRRERLVADFRSLIQNPEPGGQGDLEVPAVKRILHWVGQPALESSGAVNLTLTFQDVTQEREVSQMKSDFVSFVTHQLRTPLAGIKWLLELGAQEPGLSEDGRDYIQDARESAERLIRLVNDLLDVSRLESGKLSVVPQETCLGDLTRSVLDELEPLIREKEHRLTLKEGETLSPVLVDPQLFRQVILNLVSNAIKYTPPPGEIAIRVGQEDSAVCWAIQDSGIGIPKQAQRRLFEKFYRAENALTMETDGTGLGLYLVRLVVERFGGRIWCQSEERKGATFFFTLPRAR